jgi:tight adherence protein B
MAFLLLLPVASGLLLWWVVRNDNRRQFVQQRLSAFTRSGVGELPVPSLQRTIRQTAAFLPKDLQPWLDAAFAAAGNRIGPLHLAAAGLLAAVVVVGFANEVMDFNPAIVTLLGLVAMGLIPIVYLRVAQSRYRNRFLDVFPDALDLVRRGIRAGLPVNEALVVAAREISDPVGSELRRALDQVQVGVQMMDALHATADRIRVPDFRFMVVALALQQKRAGVSPRRWPI